MTTERLLREASQSLSAAMGAGIVAAALCAAPAQAQYAVSDTKLQADISTALHNDGKLGTTVITATAKEGVVTLEGNVASEDARLEAEQVVAGVSGVRSIQDNITIAGGSATASQGAAAGSEQAPPPPDQDVNQDPPSPDEAAPAQQAGGFPPPPPAESTGAGQQQYTPYPNGSASGQAQANPYPQQGGQYPAPYPGQGQYQQQPGYGYPSDGGFGPRGNAHVPGQAVLGVSPQQQNASGPVALPAGTLLSVRTTEPLSTANLHGGEYFQATSATDVYANGVLAIPRGAVLNGQVVEAKNAGALAGSPKLELRLTTLQLGGATYPLDSEVWSSQGPGKGGYTAANTAGGAVVGALIGAVAGGGIGAGVGAVAGRASGALISGATHGPRLDLPPEALLQFHLAPYDEAQRLAASAPQQPVLRQRPVYVAVPGPYAVRPYPYPYAYPYGYYRPY